MQALEFGQPQALSSQPRTGLALAQPASQPSRRIRSLVYSSEGDAQEGVLDGAKSTMDAVKHHLLVDAQQPTCQ